MAIPPQVIGLGMQALSGIISPISRLFLARKQRKLADEINPVRQYYKTSPFALENKTLAQNLMNGRMPGANSAAQGIQAAQSATLASAERNATSSADALAMAAAAQGAANRAAAELGDKEAQFAAGAAGMVMNANNALTAEGDKVYQDRLLDYQEKQATKNALTNAWLQNKYGALRELGGFGMMGGNALLNAKSKNGGAASWGDILSGMATFGM